jgi:hypothetical protein
MYNVVLLRLLLLLQGLNDMCMYRRYSTTTEPSPPPSSSFRSNHLKLPSQPSNKPGVFQTLFRPDLIKLSSQRQGKIGDKSFEKTMPHSSVDVSEKTMPYSLVDLSGDNSIDVDYKRDSSSMNDDYFILCDELLEESEADVIYGNSFHNRVKSKIEMFTGNKRKSNDKNHASMNHKQVFYVNKAVEMENIDYEKDISYNID